MMPAIDEALLAVSSSLAASIAAKSTITMTLGLIAARLARKSRAAVRHALLALSFGVLLVLPIVSMVGPQIRIAVPVPAQHRIEPRAFEAIGAIPPITRIDADNGSRAVVSRSTGVSPSTLLCVAWIAGAVLFLLPVAMGLRQVRSLRRSAMPWRHGQSIVERLARESGIHRHLEVLLHGISPGPMTYGLLHTVIVLPSDAEMWEQEDLNRAIVHELEHVRRGDWASHCLVRTICALYWFHPLVWIASCRLAVEAERSCDDAVLSRSEATAYADQLVALAQRLSSTPKSPVLAMASRTDLATRIGAVLDDGQRRGRAGRLALALSGFVAVLFVLAISPLRMVAGPQSPSVPEWQTAAGDKMEFEVASIHESKGAFTPPNFPLDPGSSFMNIRTHEPPRGRFSADFALRTYITFAYKLSPTRDQMDAMLARLPSWVSSERFTIQAKAEGNPTKDQMRLMMQSLLADRFHLAAHFETRETAVLALTLVKPGKTGPKLLSHADGPPCDALTPQQGSGSLRSGAEIFPPACDIYGMKLNGSMRLAASRDTTMERLAATIPTFGSVERPVVDRTGLRGTFDLTIEWTSEPPGAAPPDPNVQPGTQGPTFLEALREQLGLKLESAKAPLQILIIDHVERPTEN
jgi:bla regulator protein blaR1